MDYSAVANEALNANTTGINDIAEGDQAGLNLTTGSNNIDIGHRDVAVEADTHTHWHSRHAKGDVYSWNLLDVGHRQHCRGLLDPGSSA